MPTVMSPFEAEDYRSYLLSLCELLPRERGFRSRLARAAGCQASYFSQVLLGRSHLTEDQLLALAVHLSLASSETEVLLLLLRLEKAGTELLRSHLARQIAALKEQRAALQSRVHASAPAQSDLQLAAYVASWPPSAIHLLTSDPSHRSIESIAKRLNLPDDKVRATLDLLQQSGLVSKVDGKSGTEWHFKEGSTHLPKESIFQPTLQMSRRGLAARSIALNPPDAIHFSSVFTADAEALIDIARRIGDVVESTHAVIRNSGTSQLACMCIDLFEIV